MTVYELTNRLEDLNQYIAGHPVMILPEGSKQPLEITDVRIVDDFIILDTEAA